MVARYVHQYFCYNFCAVFTRIFCSVLSFHYALKVSQRNRCNGRSGRGHAEVLAELQIITVETSNSDARRVGVPVYRTFMVTRICYACQSACALPSSDPVRGGAPAGWGSCLTNHRRGSPSLPPTCLTALQAPAAWLTWEIEEEEDLCACRGCGPWPKAQHMTQSNSSPPSLSMV